MRLPRFVQIVPESPVSTDSAEDQHNHIERLKAVLVSYVISEQHILLEKKYIVLAIFDEASRLFKISYAVQASSPNSAFLDLPRLFSSISRIAGIHAGRRSGKDCGGPPAFRQVGLDDVACSLRSKCSPRPESILLLPAEYSRIACRFPESGISAKSSED